MRKGKESFDSFPFLFLSLLIVSAGIVMDLILDSCEGALLLLSEPGLGRAALSCRGEERKHSLNSIPGQRQTALRWVLRQVALFLPPLRQGTVIPSFQRPAKGHPAPNPNLCGDVGAVDEL